MFLWRISNYATLDGTGGLYASGRWHSIGRRVVYLSEHPAAALLEMLVNTDFSLLPEKYKLLKIKADDEVNRSRAAVTWDNWRDDVENSRIIGDTWLKEAPTALLRVPSALVPETSNYILNPAHPDANYLTIESVIDYPLDQRFKRLHPVP